MTISACSSGGSPSPTGGLATALGRVADTSGNRSTFFYDDTSELVGIAGRGLASPAGFGGLRGAAASIMVGPYSPVGYGFPEFAEHYDVSAGIGSHALTLLAGGENGAKVAARLKQLGWRQQGDTLIAPTGGSQVPTEISSTLAQVEVNGSSVSYGSSGADLSQIGQPSGPTLAQNSTMSALAGCLGNVVAASFSSFDQGGAKPEPTEYAVGVLTPSNANSVPQAEGCAAFATSAQASAYQANLTKALQHGTSLTKNEAFSKILTSSSVRNVGGAHNVIAWQANAPDDATLVFDLAQNFDLPGLPDCTQLPATARARTPGCS
jgi:hypothetical protein